MPDITALEKHPCAACGAQAEWNPAKQRLVCPFCGTESPYQVDTDTGEDPGDRSRRGAARDAGRPARLADRAPQRAVPELQGGDGLRPGARRPELRVLRLAGARGLPGDQGAHPAAEPAARSRSTRTQVRESMRAWYASHWFAPNALKRRALVDQVKGLYIPYWTFDAQVALPVDAPRPATTTTCRRGTATTRASGRRARCGRSAGSRPPARSITSSTTSRCRARSGIDTATC